MSEPDPSFSRAAQQETWRKRLATAESAYQHAAEELRQAQLSDAHGADAPVESARERKADARREYLRVLRVFTDLVLRGKSPTNEDR